MNYWRYKPVPSIWGGWVQSVVLLGLRPYSHGLYPKTGLVSQINSARSSIPLSLFHITVLRDTF
jgi:hypothetical protein